MIVYAANYFRSTISLILKFESHSHDDFPGYILNCA